MATIIPNDESELNANQLDSMITAIIVKNKLQMARNLETDFTTNDPNLK